MQNKIDSMTVRADRLALELYDTLLNMITTIEQDENLATPLKYAKREMIDSQIKGMEKTFDVWHIRTMYTTLNK